MHLTPNELAQYLEGVKKAGFFGKIVIYFEQGRPVTFKEERTIKPTDIRRELSMK